MSCITKFRAWNEKRSDSKMIYFDLMNIRGHWSGVVFDYENNVDVVDEGSSIFEEDEVMQFTGIVDNNDKEVYEGDIVQLYFIWPDGKKTVDGRPVQVMPDDLGTGFTPFINGCGCSASYFMRAIARRSGYGTTEYGYYIFEVIGNIYENRELVHNNN